MKLKELNLKEANYPIEAAYHDGKYYNGYISIKSIFIADKGDNLFFTEITERDSIFQRILTQKQMINNFGHFQVL